MMALDEHLDLYNLLKDWKLSHLFSNLRDQNITLEDLLFLNENDINKLFINLPVGEQAFFEYKLKVWKSEENHGPNLYSCLPINENSIEFNNSGFADMVIKLEDANELKSDNTGNTNISNGGTMDKSNTIPEISTNLVNLLRYKNLTIKLIPETEVKKFRMQNSKESHIVNKPNELVGLKGNIIKTINNCNDKGNVEKTNLEYNLSSIISTKKTDEINKTQTPTITPLQVRLESKIIKTINNCNDKGNVEKTNLESNLSSINSIKKPVETNKTQTPSITPLQVGLESKLIKTINNCNDKGNVEKTNLESNLSSINLIKKPVETNKTQTPSITPLQETKLLKIQIPTCNTSLLKVKSEDHIQNIKISENDKVHKSQPEEHLLHNKKRKLQKDSEQKVIKAIILNSHQVKSIKTNTTLLTTTDTKKVNQNGSDKTVMPICETILKDKNVCKILNKSISENNCKFILPKTHGPQLTTNLVDKNINKTDQETCSTSCNVTINQIKPDTKILPLKPSKTEIKTPIKNSKPVESKISPVNRSKTEIKTPIKNSKPVDTKISPVKPSKTEIKTPIKNSKSVDTKISPVNRSKTEMKTPIKNSKSVDTKISPVNRSKTEMKTPIKNSKPVKIIKTEIPPLLTILKDTNAWKAVLKYYEVNQKLQEYHRVLIIDTIAKYMQVNEYKCSMENCKKLVKQFCKIFPSEQLNKFAKKLHKNISSLKTTKTVDKKPSTRGRRKKKTKVTKLNTIESLRYNPITTDEFEVYWKLSWNLRCLAIKEEPISEVFKKWPEYKKPLGYQLISIDFCMMYPSAKELKVKWLQNQTKLFKLFKIHTFNDSITQFLVKYNECNEDSKIFATFWFLHHIFSPPKPKDTNDCQLYTITQSQETFAIVAQTSLELAEKIYTFNQRTPTVRPYIIVLGDVFNVRSICLYFNGITYPMYEALLAVDCLYKLMFVFNLEFPKESQRFFKFLQTFFYEMKLNE